MPTYVYRREDGTKFEMKQRITEDPLEKCPETGQPVERIIAGSAGLIFKGDGFYVNDYARNGSKRSGPNATAATEESSSSEAAASEPAASEPNTSGSGSDNAASSGDAASDGASSSSDS